VWNVDSGDAAQFGAEGDGPGELRRPIGLALFRDSVMVFDFRGARSRIEVYTRTGTHVGYASPPDPLEFGTFLGYSASPSGNWALWAARPFQSPSRRITRINAESTSGNTIEIPPQLLSGNSDPLAAAAVSVAISDDGVVAMGDGDNYRLALLSPDGTTTYGGREIPRRVRSQAELDSMRAEIARTFAARNIPRPPPAFDENRFRAVPHFARDGLAFDAVNRLWVKTTQSRATTIFDVFGANLQFLGSVEVDDPYIVHYHIGATLMVASTASPSMVPLVKVWRVIDPQER
jgi:hypothetical protein